MLKSGKSFSVPTWLKGFGWLAFGILALATLLVVARWWVMDSGHREARRRVDLVRRNHPPSAPATPSPAALPAMQTPDMPLSELSHFGAALSGAGQAWNEFAAQIDEINTFLRFNESAEFADGLRSFRALLRKMGTAVPDNMTEEEAAKEYLKQADRFATFLARWREAVAKGPLGASKDPRFIMTARTIFELLGMTMEARLRCGDPAGAWEDWQAMKNTKARCRETYPTGSYSGDLQDSRIERLALLGMRCEAWTSGQMTEISSLLARKNAVADMRRNVEDIKQAITDYYANFDRNRESFSRSILKTPSQFDQVVNQVKLKLITDQQIRDNRELELADMDRISNLFDPETGFYIRPPEDGTNPSPGTGGTPGGTDLFYFMIRDFRMGNVQDFSGREYADHIIRSQSETDQFRLALALETYRQKTGNYPDHLESVSDQFPTGPPMDIATGQPYLYQKNQQGGYELWSTGIDGRNDGGDVRNDVTWRHRPVKSK